MKTNHIKLLTIAVFTLSAFATLLFQTNAAVYVKAEGDAAATYKTKCAMCHSPKAAKKFDPTKAIDVLTEVILKGDSTSKPKMPGYEAKGMTADEAKALAEYMVSLRKPAETDTETPAAAEISEETVATYKAKCAMCHSPKAAKKFDATKADDVLVEVVMKGNSTSKPKMPGYEAKGMTTEEAAALVSLMKSLQE